MRACFFLGLVLLLPALGEGDSAAADDSVALQSDPQRFDGRAVELSCERAHPPATPRGAARRTRGRSWRSRPSDGPFAAPRTAAPTRQSRPSVLLAVPLSAPFGPPTLYLFLSLQL